MTGVVDVHSHFLPDWYREAAIAAGIPTPDGMPRWPSWSVEDHLTLMDAQGIERSILSISSPGVHFGDPDAAIALAARVNDFAAGLQDEYPDRFGFFASLPFPEADAAMIELERAFALGASGVVVQSNVHGRYLGDPVYEPLWRALNARRAPLFIHPTSPQNHEAVDIGVVRPAMEFLFDTTRTITSLAVSGALDRHPDLQVIVPHCGAVLPLLMDRVDLFRRLAGGITESLAPALSRLWFDLAGVPMPAQLPAVIDRFGSDHLLYGSDYCFTSPQVVAELMAALDEHDEEIFPKPWRQLVADNVQELGIPLP